MPGFIRNILDMVFPRPAEVFQFDHVDHHTLARTAVRTSAELTPPVLAPLPYHHPLVREAVHAAKYQSHERAALLLGRALAGHVAEELAERRMYGTFQTPFLLPVPLHPVRQKERGYNQAERIARALLEELADEAVVYETNLLERVRHTEPQAQQTSRLKRSENIRYAFTVTAPEHVRGRDVIVLDDVVTTGATLHTVHGVLRRAGARNILLIAVAH